MNFNSIPGIELHLHAEGAIPRQYLWQKRLQQEPELQTEAFDKEFKYDHFSQFVALWCDYQRLLFGEPHNYANFKQAKELGVHPAPLEILPELAKSLFNQGIIYAELHVSPIDASYMKYGRELIYHADFYNSIVRAWQLACKQCNQFYADHLNIRLILDLVRNYPSDVHEFQIKNLAQLRPQLDQFVAVGLGGGNDSKSLFEFDESFKKIRAMGLGVVVHAGEHLPEAIASREVAEAIQLKVDRIGHGIHGYANNLHALIETQTIVEICPTSNLMTGSVDQLSKHPLIDMLHKGLNCVIGSDDPTYVDTSLAEEMQIAFELYSHSVRSDNTEYYANYENFAQKLLTSAINASYADESLKGKLRNKISNGVIK